MMGPAGNPYLAMAQNNAWANATLYRALASLDDAGFSAPRSGFFGSLCRTMNHIHEVDVFYLDALKAGGKGRAVYQREDILNAAQLARAQAATDSEFVAFCAEVDAEILEQARKTERKRETVYENVGVLILHLVQHQIHHRGQAHVMIGEAGIKPPQLDDFYLDFGRDDAARPFWR